MPGCHVTIKQEGYGFAIGLKIPSQPQPIRIDRISYDPDEFGQREDAERQARASAKLLRESLLKCGPVRILGAI